jgi:hypothetical protein
MIVYSAWSGDEDDCHYATKREAIAAARQILKDDPYAYSYDKIEVTRHEVVPLTKQSFLDILNSSGGKWSASSETVAIVKRRGKPLKRPEVD